MTRVPGIALIVPVHDDTAALERLLEHVAAWPRAPDEVIVVASSSGGAGVERVCAAHGARLLGAPANRGAQLDTGARAAAAEVLWFVHATSDLPADGLETIAAEIAAGAESGCFELAFQGERRWFKRGLELLVALRIRWGGVPYGDQALFATYEAYSACGGFAREPLFEEVGLVRRLRNRGTFRIVGRRVGVATRRWERDGWLRRSLANRWLALRHMLGTPPAVLARRYRRAATGEDLHDKEARS